MRLSPQFFAGLFAGCLLTLLAMASLDKGFWSEQHKTPSVVADNAASGGHAVPPQKREAPSDATAPFAKEHAQLATEQATKQATAENTAEHSPDRASPDRVSPDLVSPDRASEAGLLAEREKAARLFPSFPLPETISAVTYASHSSWGTLDGLATSPHAASLDNQHGGAGQSHLVTPQSPNRGTGHGLHAKNSPLFKSTPNKFSFHCMGTGDGPTLLVIGGIQGDEPGGFSAASLLSTHYTITRGNLWIVPDLNFASIVKRNRGLFGDMNRKFAHLSADDPEYALIQGIKTILLADEVDLILNLHDGSGFYSPTWVNKLRNPNRWGQSVIIDKVEMEAPRFNKLHHMASKAEEDANKALVHPDHRYFIRNTNTHLGDKEMEKSLSWFAVLNGKPAFGIEASKEFTTEYRSYYHMLVVESFMRQMGIEFERNFDLSPKNVLVALNSDITLSL